MGKQALGIYMSNFNKRIDTMGNILNYPQKSLVYTKLSKYTMAHKLPSGVNAIVAIMTHTGFNQEDSIMVNQSALDRGLFTSTYYKAMRDVCSKNHSTGEEEIFANPVPMTSTKPYSYNKLNDDGFVSKNTYVNGNDVIVGKVMPKKVNGIITYQDNSLSMKPNDDGYIDMNYSGINSDGYKFCKIRIRKNRKPEIGDKCASCSAQKGTIGMIYRHQDMPFTKDGVVPDIIMNPHAIPSRMTMAQLMECIMGKAGCHIGACGDATPFGDCSVESIAKVLEQSGMERYGNEIMYNGRTGEQIQTEIFIGPTYYQRLKHMVEDKIHCLTGDHEVLTENGWKFIPDITLEDKVAILKNDKLVYENPMEIHHYPEYSGKMYRVKNQAIDLNVTANHRMYVKINGEFTLEKAENIVGKKVIYKDESGNDIVVNNGIAEDELYDYQGAVYCLSVSSEIFLVRRDEKPGVWTGNSRGSNGPIVMLTRQPSEGRSKCGGLRLGEMERDCLIGHGISEFLKEKMLDTSDNYRIFICRTCGLLCDANPNKNIYKCRYCKTSTDIAQLRIPYSFKLLMQELYTMGVKMALTSS